MAAQRYSAMLLLSIKQPEAIRVYPTIVESKQLFIESNQKVDRVIIELVDMNGRTAQSEQHPDCVGRQTLHLNARNRTNNRSLHDPYYRQ